MRVVRHSIFPASADEVWGRVLMPETLEYINAGMISMEPVELPDDLVEGAVIRMKVSMLRTPPFDYTIRIARLDQQGRVALTHEHGGVVRRWVHRITVEPLSAGRCLYTDQVDIDAGPLTAMVWAFASVMYRRRQRRWLDLLAKGEAISNRAI